jgi:hypothetical protein
MKRVISTTGMKRKKNKKRTEIDLEPYPLGQFLLIIIIIKNKSENCIISNI